MSSSATLSPERIAELISPYITKTYEQPATQRSKEDGTKNLTDSPTAVEVLATSSEQSWTLASPPNLYAQLSKYLDLLLKWNAKTNLTAIREPEEIVRRHFGESLFAAGHLATGANAPKTLLDFGSGAGFPGLPIQLLRPDIAVTLAESQNKKAAFLREAVRTLGLRTEVWDRRVEAMPLARQFDVVAMRAVDDMDVAIRAALPRVGSTLLMMTTPKHRPVSLPGFEFAPGVRIPGAREQELAFAQVIE